MSATFAARKHKKGYKGLGMEGAVASWYASTTGTGIEQFRKEARALAVGLPDNASILEVAPGPGFLAIELARLGKFEVTGLDISKTLVEIATENARKAGVAVAFRLGNASAMPFEDASFDQIVCRAAFKNFSEPVARSRRCIACSNPAAKRPFSTCDAMRLRKRSRRKWTRCR